MPFTPEEKARIKTHLSYPVVGSYGALRAWGQPIAEPIMNEMTHALDAVLPEGEGVIRLQLDRLDCIRSQIDEARGAVLLSKADKVEMNPMALQVLWGEYVTERGRMADMLSVDKYHHSYLTGAENGGCVEPF